MVHPLGTENSQSVLMAFNRGARPPFPTSENYLPPGHPGAVSHLYISPSLMSLLFLTPLSLDRETASVLFSHFILSFREYVHSGVSSSTLTHPIFLSPISPSRFCCCSSNSPMDGLDTDALLTTHTLSFPRLEPSAAIHDLDHIGVLLQLHPRLLPSSVDSSFLISFYPT